MSTWSTTPLRGLIAEVSVRKGGTSPEILSVTNANGFVRSLDVFDKQVFSHDTSNYKLVSFNDLAYNPSRINVGSVALCQFPEGGAVSPMYVVVRCRKSLLPQFLLYFLKSNIGRQYIEHHCVGAVRFQLRFGDLERIKLPLPPLPEQQYIVEILDEADALLSMRLRADQKTVDLIPALFAEMFDKPLFPRVALEEIVTKERNSFVNGPFGSDLLSSELTNEGVPVIYIRDISAGRYERKSIAFVTPTKAAQLRFCNVLPGDVLITKVGTPPGVAAIYPTNEPDGIVTQDVIRVRPDTKIVIPEYVVGFLNSSKGHQELKKIMIQATRQRFSLGNFKKISIPKPPIR